MFGNEIFTITIGGEEFHIPKIPTLGLMRQLSAVESRVSGLSLDDPHRNMECIAGFLCAALGKEEEWVNNLPLPEAMNAIKQIMEVWGKTGFFPVKGQQTEAEGQVNTGG